MPPASDGCVRDASPPEGVNVATEQDPKIEACTDQLKKATKRKHSLLGATIGDNIPGSTGQKEGGEESASKGPTPE